MTGRRAMQVLDLLADYALDPLGRLDGLTSCEFGRAWAARHGTTPPMSTLWKLSQEGDARDVLRRSCVVSGKRMVAWVPRQMCN